MMDWPLCVGSAGVEYSNSQCTGEAPLATLATLDCDVTKYDPDASKHCAEQWRPVPALLRTVTDDELQARFATCED
ncbi:unnamed protein product, partial [Iphiclides podalirius]